MLELVITAAQCTRKLLNEEPCHSGGFLPGSFCRYKSWNFVMFWLIGNRVIIALKLYMKVTCSIVTWSIHKLASVSPQPQLLKQRESKYVYFFVSLCILSELFYMLPPNVIFYLCQEEGFDKFSIQCSFGKANFSYQFWAGNETIFQRNEQHHFWTDLLWERIAELYFLARSRKVESIFFFFFFRKEDLVSTLSLSWGK